jgi:hypothetical protein
LNHKSIPRGIPSDSLSVDNALGDSDVSRTSPECRLNPRL